MLMTRFVGGMSLVGMTVLGASAASAQDYPNKPVRIVTFTVGGGTDVSSRIIAQGLTANLGWQVIVDNRSGGGGAIAVVTVARAQPDGYTMLLFGSSFWLLPLLKANMPYDAAKDFSPITLAVTAPNIFVVHPSLPVKSIKELVDLAKAKPGELNYASGGPGTASHLWAELFKSMAGVNIVHIPYTGMGPAINALIGAQVQLAVGTPGAVKPHLTSGRLMALAIGNAQPSALFPDLPTVAASGLPGFESAQVTGIYAPAKTLAAIIKRLNHEIVQALKRTDVKEKFFNLGYEVVGSTPEQLAATVKTETTKMGKLITELGIREE